jgi:uncharacterized membrane protein
MRYDDFASQLQKELPAWVSAGLVSVEQSEALSLRYGAGSGAELRRSKAAQAIAVIGAIAAGLGVILFFAANWDAIPEPARVALLLSVLVGSYAGGWKLLERRPLVGHALILLGAIAFGAGIFLVGQMYHVQAHDPLAFAIWSAAVAPLAWVLRSRALTTLTGLTLGGWIVYELVDALGSSAYDTTFFAIPVALMLYGAVLYGAGSAIALPWASGPMRGLGYALVTAGAFALTFAATHEEIDGEPFADTAERIVVALGALALAGATALLVRRGPRWELFALVAVAVLGLVAVLAPAPPLAMAMLFNALLAGLAFGAVVLGYREDELWLATSGLVVVTIDVFARFVDFSWGFLPRSTGFLAAGVLLIGLAFVLERSRSQLASRMATR